MAKESPNLEQLLNVVEALDPDKRTKEEAAPSDEELREARTGLHEALKDVAAGEAPDLEAGRAIRQAIDSIDAALVTRAEEREAQKAEAAKLLEGLEDVKAETDDGGDGEGEDKGEDDAAAEEDDKGDEAEAKTSVAASIDLAKALGRSSKRRIERVNEPKPDASVITAALGPAQGYGLSQDATLDDVAELFSKYSPQVKRGGSVLVHQDRVYPESRSLGLSATENTRILDAVTSPRAITAAGGICDPLPADFSNPFCGDRGRPITNALPGFRADRGGIRFAPSATVADLEEAITVWTNATDTTPGSDTKACPRVDCEEEQTASVDAVVACLTVGNFQARFNPEFWRSRLDLLMVAHDRIAEQTAYANIESNSTQITAFTGSTGTTMDVLQAVDAAIAGLVARHRLIGTRYQAIMLTWLQDAMRSQLAGQLPAGTLNLFDVADAQLTAMFTGRGVDPVWSPDVDISSYATQNAGALDAFPSEVTIVLYPVGTWLFLDGGTLDLGTQIVDSTLNAVNDRQAFMETFEQVVQRGCESLSIPVNIGDGCICGGLS